MHRPRRRASGSTSRQSSELVAKTLETYERVVGRQVPGGRDLLGEAGIQVRDRGDRRGRGRTSRCGAESTDAAPNSRSTAPSCIAPTLRVARGHRLPERPLPGLPERRCHERAVVVMSSMPTRGSERDDVADCATRRPLLVRARRRRTAGTPRRRKETTPYNPRSESSALVTASRWAHRSAGEVPVTRSTRMRGRSSAKAIARVAAAEQNEHGVEGRAGPGPRRADSPHVSNQLLESAGSRATCPRRFCWASNIEGVLRNVQGFLDEATEHPLVVKVACRTIEANAKA